MIFCLAVMLLVGRFLSCIDGKPQRQSYLQGQCGLKSIKSGCCATGGSRWMQHSAASKCVKKPALH